MKRMWIGVGLLAVLLVSGILVANLMEQNHFPLAEDLDRAAKLALEDQWDTAEALTARAEKSWQKKRLITACFAEHEPVEEIDGLFARLEIYAETRNADAYGGTCVDLASRLEALGKTHGFTLWNLL